MSFSKDFAAGPTWSGRHCCMSGVSSSEDGGAAKRSSPGHCPGLSPPGCCARRPPEFPGRLSPSTLASSHDFCAPSQPACGACEYSSVRAGEMWKGAAKSACSPDFLLCWVWVSRHVHGIPVTCVGFLLSVWHFCGMYGTPVVHMGFLRSMYTSCSPYIHIHEVPMGFLH